MTHRTTFALDEPTARRLKRLASVWKVSQAEVVRRSVEQAEQVVEALATDPLALLEAFHAKGGVDVQRATAWMSEVDEGRSAWRTGA